MNSCKRKNPEDHDNNDDNKKQKTNTDIIQQQVTHALSQALGQYFPLNRGQGRGIHGSCGRGAQRS